MKICLVTTFPPSGRQLNEYGFYIARELQRNPHIDLTILSDELTDYEFATDADGKSLNAPNRRNCRLRSDPLLEVQQPGQSGTFVEGHTKVKPDVVWFNLVFSSFGTPEYPVAAFAGLSAPALTRAFGYYTHITLHHVIEHVDFASAGVRRERMFRLGSDMATRALLRANSVSVLLSGYRRTLVEKYSAENVLLGTHGTFASCPTPPDFTTRGNPQHRILAIGHWGTYKRLETLMEAFPAVLKKVPNAKLVIAGANHHTKPGYWESIRESHKHLGSAIEFRGYVPEDAIPDLFSTSSIVAMPYDSATGSSGPAHQACEYGVPIVCADINDFRDMAADEDMAISFYKIGDATNLADQLVAILQSPEQQLRMAEQNFSAAMKMTMSNVVGNYLRWFELKRAKKAIGAASSFSAWPASGRRSDSSSRQKSARVNRDSSTGVEGLNEPSAGESAQALLRTDSASQQP